MYIFLYCILVLDINCQHLGNVCQLEGFCAPFGRRVGEYVWSGMYSFLYVYRTTSPWGPICRQGAQSAGARFAGAQFAAKGPNLPGPDLPGPNLPGPNLPGPNL